MCAVPSAPGAAGVRVWQIRSRGPRTGRPPPEGVRVDYAHGGIALGIGGALYEQFKYDENGQPLSLTFMDYLLPSMAEVPPMALAEHETPAPGHPLGAKAAGESGSMAAIPTVVSAVENAVAHLGVQVTRTPVTPDALFRAIGRAAPEGVR